MFQHARSTAMESLGSNISDEKRRAHEEMCRALKSCLSDEEVRRTQALADDSEIMQSGRIVQLTPRFSVSNALTRPFQASHNQLATVHSGCVYRNEAALRRGKNRM